MEAGLPGEALTLGHELIPGEVPNWIDGRAVAAQAAAWIEKYDPATGKLLCRVARSTEADVATAVTSAVRAQRAWATLTPVRRGEILHDIADGMRAQREALAAIVSRETGKSPKNALGETDGAIALALFMAGEGQRLYGRTTTSGAAHKWALTVRQPVGVAGLIIAANTPIANVAWKVFPALICGNAAVLKAAEDTPATAHIFAQIAQRAGLPEGVLQVIQGLGPEAGAPLVRHPDVGVISFTGSTKVGREIAAAAGDRVKKVSLELGGKNPFVVCDDADLGAAVHWALQSAFSNAGQRCASGSRLLVFESVYADFRDRMVAATEKLKVGPTDADDFGPVINERQLNAMLGAVERARASGARVLTGGQRLQTPAHQGGYYMAPTLVENVEASAEISVTELFGPIATLYSVPNFDAALSMANDSPYGLTACIHTRNVHRALQFCTEVQSGVAVVNGGTFGSEPHMPFGGVKQSGNGSREPGTEALDIYSNLKDIYFLADPGQL